MSLFDTGASAVADPFLRRAFELAELARGDSAPNPLVGCVIVSDGAVVGEGYHARAGEPHAEAVALDRAGAAATGSTAYVTLEPCNHEGRTPPCAPALARAGVSHVVIGMRDPNPEVTGCGAKYLRDRGIGVTFASDDTPMRRQNEAWLHRLATGRPFVRVKLALSLDGHAALAVGRRARITGVGGRSVTMALRERANAVAVGAATVAIDDPGLTVRSATDAPGERQRTRVVLSRTTVPSVACRLATDGAAPTLVVAGDGADRAALDRLAQCGVTVVQYPLALGIAGALTMVAERGIDDLLVEAGPGLLTSLHDARCIDELVCVHAGGWAGVAAPPLYLGSHGGRDDVLGPQYEAVDAAVLDGDAITVWRPLVGVSDTRAESA